LSGREVPAAEEKPAALVSDIQRFCIHDGPGIRTTVFFKGCPLRCLWCQNPETLKFENELVFSAERCIACGDCAKTCPNQAIKFNKGPQIIWQNCQSCFTCCEVCPSRAREPAGKEYSADELAREILKDREFYQPEGGVTLSGGEPFAQPKFLMELFPILKREKIHITAETCGHFNYEAVLPVLKMVDLILFDFKALNPDLHQRLTGKDNELILKNLRRILELKIPRQIRMPLIPGFNDQESELKEIAKFLIALGEKELWLLPYHRMGESKLKKLHTDLKPLGLKSYSESDLRAKAEIVAACGIAVRTFSFTVPASKI